jgi:hypothetical protein
MYAVRSAPHQAASWERRRIGRWWATTRAISRRRIGSEWMRSGMSAWAVWPPCNLSRSTCVRPIDRQHRPDRRFCGYNTLVAVTCAINTISPNNVIYLLYNGMLYFVGFGNHRRSHRRRRLHRRRRAAEQFWGPRQLYVEKMSYSNVVTASSGQRVAP